ncbi:hypothetical protein LO762_24510 [Actinocorallia sp. API 0066]|uniref:hypothetical protein n=1 Tax=Actinocorallia sp. API 0066 TaxID=2896846 RepID=UPI001E63B052|nr:hypothetical protein [Actinocorallia sp. API 0066]MCD0452330.1 hypothetical protein [Actinocorallia sp. API 0066]
MDIKMSFREPRVRAGASVCELELYADRLVFGGSALRVLRRAELVLDVPYHEVTAVELPARRSVAALRERHPKAYFTWTDEEDARLRTLLGEGVPLHAICAELGRGRNAVLARTLRLGVLRAD